MNIKLSNFLRCFKLPAVFLAGSLGVSALFASEGAISGQPRAENLVLLKNEGKRDAETAKLGFALEKSLRSYEAVNDYSAIFHKQEEKDGRLGDKERIYLKFEKPFKIYMRWLNTAKEGLQVFYERGRHQGKLVIHKPGLLFGLVPVLFLDQTSPWVREGSASYNIEDAGIGTFLYDFTRAALKAAREKKLKVKFSAPEPPFEGSLADVTFIRTVKDSTFFAYRVVVLFDGGTKLPTRMELYDWDNKPMGVYAYEDLKLNVGPDDPDFRKRTNPHLYKIYREGDTNYNELREKE